MRRGRSPVWHRFINQERKNGFTNASVVRPSNSEIVQFESEIRAKLNQFKDSDMPNLTFPPMNRDERKKVHEIARKMNYETKSTGEEPNRCIVIMKKTTTSYTRALNTTSEAIVLNKNSIEKIKNFNKKFPITDNEVDRFLTEKKLKEGYHHNRSAQKMKPMVPPTVESADSVLLQKRRELPSYKHRQDIINAVNQNNVVIISGGTGCGKTTQVPQFILEEASETKKEVRIMCTQPRRLAAITIAERVAKERGEKVGETVGYHVRLEQKTSDKTILTFCTSGVLLRMLSTDTLATGITHIILDEIHERETNTDYLLIALKQALQYQSNIKVILMSATIEGNMALFKSYFYERIVDIIRIESKLFDVKRIYLDEVLAMIGYEPPKSTIGYFQEDGFPSMGVWDAQEQNRLASYANTMPIIDNFCFEKRFLHYINAAPPTVSQNKLVANQLKREAEIERNYRYDLKNALPRPSPYFVPSVLKQVKRANIAALDLEQKYLECGGREFIDSIDVNLVSATIRYFADSPILGAILVFLPGYENISQVREKMEEWKCSLVNYMNVMILCLHSQMNTIDQSTAFRPAPRNTRKVILATNIAEASITIEDVVFVIDTGKVKEKVYRHDTKISQLLMTTIAKSNAEQRAGRAGRVRNGFCVRLYSEAKFYEMPETQLAEIKRAPIYDVCLHAKLFAPKGIRVAQFLSMAPEPPSIESIEQSMDFLETLGALYLPSTTSKLPEDNLAQNEDAELTDLGRIMAQMPLDPQLARLLVFGLALNCLTPIVNLVAVLSYRDPFILVLKFREKLNCVRERLARRDFSDHLMLIRLIDEFADLSFKDQIKYCRNNFLNINTMKMVIGVRRQLLAELARARLIDDDSMMVLKNIEYNRNSNCWPMVQAAIAAGCYPYVGISSGNSNKLRKVQTHTGTNSSLHPSSILKRQTNMSAQSIDDDPLLQFVVYQELAMIENGLRLRTVTALTAASVLLFTGPLRLKKSTIEDYSLAKNDNGDDDEDDDDDKDDDENDDEKRDIGLIQFFKIESWYAVRAQKKDLRHLLRLRLKFMHYLLRGLREPYQFKLQNAENEELLDTIRTVLVEENVRCRFGCAEMPNIDENCVMPQTTNRNDSYYHEETNEEEAVTSDNSRVSKNGNGEEEDAQQNQNTMENFWIPKKNVENQKNFVIRGGKVGRGGYQQHQNNHQQRYQNQINQQQRQNHNFYRRGHFRRNNIQDHQDSNDDP